MLKNIKAMQKTRAKKKGEDPERFASKTNASNQKTKKRKNLETLTFLLPKLMNQTKSQKKLKVEDPNFFCFKG